MDSPAPKQGHKLSFGPESLWYLDKLTPHSPVYNVPFLSRLTGDLRVIVLEKALNALVDRQPVLRTVFLPSRGAPTAIVLKKRPADLKQLDLRNLPHRQRETEARRLARLEAARKFDLKRDAMLRTFLFRLSEDDYFFLFVTHHIVFELGSLAILHRDLSAFYNAFLTGTAPDLPAVTFHDSDFSIWQRNYLSGDRLELLKNFWIQQLRGTAQVNLPLDFPRPPAHTHRGARHFFDISPQLCANVVASCRNLGTTPYRGMLAAFYVFLWCYSGVTDLCVGSPFASRCPGIANTVGFFANTIVLRADLSGDPSFRELVKKVDWTVLRGLMSSELSFEKIVEAVQPPRDASRTPLFQTSFRGRTEPYARLRLNNVTAEQPEFIDNGTSKFDFAMEVEITTGKACFVEYCSDLFREETILQMEEDYLALLSDLIAHCDIPLSQIASAHLIRNRVRP